MSTRVVRCLKDFVRHGMSVEVVCKCGHYGLLDPRWVCDRFDRKGWHTGLTGATWLDSPYMHFFCSKCFLRTRRIVRPVRIGPGYR